MYSRMQPPSLQFRVHQVMNEERRNLSSSGTVQHFFQLPYFSQLSVSFVFYSRYPLPMDLSSTIEEKKQRLEELRKLREKRRSFVSVSNY